MTSSGLEVLGRLLVLGTLGGAVVGALTGLVVAAQDWDPWGGGVVLVAAVAGTVVGPLVQAVTAAVVLSLRAHPAHRSAAVVVPVVAALLLTASALSVLDPPLTIAGAAGAVSVAATALLAVRLRSWCLGD